MTWCVKIGWSQRIPLSASEGPECWCCWCLLVGDLCLFCIPSDHVILRWETVKVSCKALKRNKSCRVNLVQHETWPLLTMLFTIILLINQECEYMWMLCGGNAAGMQDIPPKSMHRQVTFAPCSRTNACLLPPLSGWCERATRLYCLRVSKSNVVNS